VYTKRVYLVPFGAVLTDSYGLSIIGNSGHLRRQPERATPSCLDE